MSRIIVIPDTQIKKGVPTEHLEGLGNYIVDKKPDRIVHLGDHWDMPSLSTYTNKASIEYVGANYAEDLQAGNEAMDVLMGPIQKEIRRQKRNKKKVWKPDMHFCMGNHEHRRTRLLNQDPWLAGALGDYNAEDWGWKVHPFLQPVKLDGVNFCHYAQGGAMGRPISRAHLIATKKHESWIVGHQQVLDIYLSPHVKTDGTRVQCMIAGAFYEHEEGYMQHQGNQHWRGAIMLNEVQGGSYDFTTLSLDYLKENWT